MGFHHGNPSTLGDAWRRSSCHQVIIPLGSSRLFLLLPTNQACLPWMSSSFVCDMITWNPSIRETPGVDHLATKSLYHSAHRGLPPTNQPCLPWTSNSFVCDMVTWKSINPGDAWRRSFCHQVIRTYNPPIFPLSHRTPSEFRGCIFVWLTDRLLFHLTADYLHPKRREIQLQPQILHSLPYMHLAGVTPGHKRYRHRGW